MDDPRRRPEDPATADGSLEPATGQAPPRLPPDIPVDGPLTRDAARELLDRAGDLLQDGDYGEASALYRRVVGFDDPTVTAAALLGLAETRYRLDDEEAAIATWEAILELPETPSTYHAWRNIAAARVREGDLQGAVKAYREADRRAPPADKAEIASRLGWLAKETGNTGAARRYFARARGAGPAIPLSWLIIGLTVIVSFAAESVGGAFLFELLGLDKAAVAQGEYYRLWTVTLVHGGLLHLFFNMYALYLCGPLVEQLYGSRLFLAFYLLCAAAGSTASFVFGGGEFSVGASGAIFGLFGVLLAASRTHNPVLDRRGRSLVSQIGMLILINLALGFALGGLIDNAAHVGGLLAGLWLGVLIVPGRVPTLRSMWQRPGGGAIQPVTTPMLLPALGVVALVVVLAVGIVVGTSQRGGSSAIEPQIATVTALQPSLIASSRADTASLSSSIRSPSARSSTRSTSSARRSTRSRASR